MARYSNQEIITSIQNGEEDVLFYLTGKYFQSSRRWLRRRGIQDSKTPSVFSIVLLKVYREIQKSDFSKNNDVEILFFNSLKEELNQSLANEKEKTQKPEEEIEIIARCFHILSDESKKILSERYVENLSFEHIASKENFSNPVIAEFEFTKAYSQFENIIKSRLYVDLKES